MSDREEMLRAIRSDADDADQRLDEYFPSEFARFRRQHTTPVQVSLRAARWLAEPVGAHVLDVGAGAGRFCIVGAVATTGRFTGVERRANLVESARNVASALGAERAEFIHGDARSLAWEEFTGFYLFNPFLEHTLPDDERIDEQVPHDRERQSVDVAWVETALACARTGTRVVTWNGFGGYLNDYLCVRRTYLRNVPLECFVRR